MTAVALNPTETGRALAVGLEDMSDAECQKVVESGGRLRVAFVCIVNARGRASVMGMNEEPILCVRRLLIEEHGIAAANVTDDARIVHDLGVDGDDATELLQRLHSEFGTDFQVLDEQWKLFFNNEGPGPRSFLVGIPLLLVCGGAAGIAVGRYGWPKYVAYGLALIAFFTTSRLLSRWFGTELRPLTVSGLANIVEAGRWPSNPADVR